jgi:hypothetical protein
VLHSSRNIGSRSRCMPAAVNQALLLCMHDYCAAAQARTGSTRLIPAGMLAATTTSCDDYDSNGPFVCADNGKTYQNKCLATCSGARTLHSGQCQCTNTAPTQCKVR